MKYAVIFALYSTKVKPYYSNVSTSTPTQNAAPQATAKGDAVLLDIRDGGVFLGLTEWQMRGLLLTGLPTVKVGRKFYFRRSTLLKWAERAEGKYKG